MFYSHPLHGLHNDLVVVNRYIGRLINGRKLVLCRRNLIMLRLGCYPQLPELLVEILHILANTLSDYAKVMILHLLTLGSGRAEKGSACKHQIRSLHI